MSSEQTSVTIDPTFCLTIVVNPPSEKVAKNTLFESMGPTSGLPHLKKSIKHHISKPTLFHIGSTGRPNSRRYKPARRASQNRTHEASKCQRKEN